MQKEPYKEELLMGYSRFPVDIFIRENIEEKVEVSPHWHECVEILFILEGAAMQQVNENYFPVVKHDIIILREGDIHSTICTEGEEVRILVVKFMPEAMGGSLSWIAESKYIMAFLYNRNQCIFHITEHFSKYKEISSLLMDAYSEFQKKETGYELYIKAYIYQMIACFTRYNIMDIHPPIRDRNNLSKLEPFFKYIEINYKENIDLQKAADLMNLSYAYFSRYFKKVTGKTFKDYVDFVRICEVEKLILGQRMNISQAAYECGFCNVASFNRVFKRVRGYQPSSILRSKTAK